MLEKSSTIIWLIYDIWKRLKDLGMLLKMLLLTPIRVGSGLKQGGTFHSHEILLPYLRNYFFSIWTQLLCKTHITRVPWRTVICDFYWFLTEFGECFNENAKQILSSYGC